MTSDTAFSAGTRHVKLWKTLWLSDLFLDTCRQRTQNHWEEPTSAISLETPARTWCLTPLSGGSGKAFNVYLVVSAGCKAFASVWYAIPRKECVWMSFNGKSCQRGQPATLCGVAPLPNEEIPRQASHLQV